jgi:hypothetical protein
MTSAGVQITIPYITKIKILHFSVTMLSSLTAYKLWKVHCKKFSKNGRRNVPSLSTVVSFNHPNSNDNDRSLYSATLRPRKLESRPNTCIAIQSPTRDILPPPSDIDSVDDLPISTTLGILVVVV